jgi:hypothetical protein
VRVLGVDTATKKGDRGYGLAEDGALLWYSTQRPGPEIGVHVVAGERPWQGGKLRGERQITFCVNNGFQLRDAWDYGPEMCRPLYVLLPVWTWKNLVLPGCAGYPGDVFCRNFQQKYAPHVTDHNQLDALGIALAASRLTLAELKKFVPEGFKR